MYLKINLQRGVLVSDCDAHLLEKHLFYITSDGYAKTRIGKSMVYLHRMILPDVKFVDHINRSKIDNRRENLREASSRDNRNNQDKPITNTSGYKGVTKNSSGSCFSARITVEGKRITLGSFLTKEQAAQAYNIAALKYHGKFAVLNNII